jgi:hypothetical protein
MHYFFLEKYFRYASNLANIKTNKYGPKSNIYFLFSHEY